MNDPLLNQTWAPPTETKTEVPTAVVRANRQKHPAASSRILAVGISVAAVIGMSAAYTKAQHLQPVQPQVLDNASNALLTVNPTTAVVPQQQTYAQPQTNVVQIPVPQAGPATGGTTTQNTASTQQNAAPTQQKSSGSH